MVLFVVTRIRIPLLFALCSTTVRAHCDVCSGCPKGKYSKSGSCQINNAMAAKADCIPCPPGTYGASGCDTSEKCSGWCPAGKYGAGGSTSSSCTGECKAGFYGVLGRGKPKYLLLLRPAIESFPEGPPIEETYIWQICFGFFAHLKIRRKNKVKLRERFILSIPTTPLP